MARTIHIAIPHRLGVEGARRRVDKGLADLKSEFGRYASSISETWSGNTLAVEIRAMGTATSSTVDVTPDVVQVSIRPPLLLRPLAGQIESYINRHAPKFFQR